MKNLQRTITDAHSQDKDAMEELLIAFYPLIKKYARKLSYEDAEQDLVLFFIELVNFLPVEKFQQGEEGQIVSYIQKAVIHQYYKLDKKNRNYDLYWEDSGMEPAEDIASNEANGELSLLFQCLSEKQRRVLELRIYHQFSDSQIGEMLGISRQAVYKDRKNAIKKLKEELRK